MINNNCCKKPSLWPLIKINTLVVQCLLCNHIYSASTIDHWKLLLSVDSYIIKHMTIMLNIGDSDYMNNYHNSLPLEIQLMIKLK